MHYGDASHYSAFEEDIDGGHKSLNLDKSKEKEIEFRADQFAADQIKKASADTNNVERFVAGISVQIAILSLRKKGSSLAYKITRISLGRVCKSRLMDNAPTRR